MLAPPTSAASPALACGKMNARPSRAARHVIASAPRTGRSSPVSESSPANSYFENPSASSWREAARMPSAIGKSNLPLSRSEEHTSELQSLTNLVCRLLLEKKKKKDQDKVKCSTRSG